MERRCAVWKHFYIAGTILMQLTVMTSAFNAYATFGDTSEEDISSFVNAGSFVSTNYPSSYPHNQDRHYRNFFSTGGPQQIRLDFTTLLPEPILRLCHDFIRLQNHSNVWCGHGNGSTYVDIPDNEFHMFFHSNSRTSDKGFNFTFTLLEGSCRPTLNLPGNWESDMLLITDILTRDSIVMSIRGCASVVTVFGTSDKSMFLGSRQLVIGGWNNTKTLLRNCVGSRDEDCIPVREVAHSPWNCCQFGDAWFQWNDTALNAGTGSVVTQNTFLSESFPEPIAVRFLYLTGYIDIPFVAKINAPFPDSYCTKPANLSLPEHCASRKPETSVSFQTKSVTYQPSRNSRETSLTYQSITSNIHPVTTNPGTGESSQGSATVPESTLFSSEVKLNSEINTDSSQNMVISTEENAILPGNTAGEILTAKDPLINAGYTRGAEVVTSRRKPEICPPVTSLSRSSLKRCPCNCVMQSFVASIHDVRKGPEQKLEELKEMLAQKIRKKLMIARRNVSAVARRYVSAGDHRKSSQVMGAIIGLFCFLPLLLIVADDLITVRASIKTT